jgi:serine/threonine protein kinase/WD40 repeat protein/tetratricopeptide (TPR) repeat protein
MTQAEGRSGNGAPASQDDPRVIAALEEYLDALKQGRRPDRKAFEAAHADIATALAECLDGLEFIQSAGPRLQESAAEASARASASAAPGPEAPLGDFRIVGEVGRGGMGVVYEAVQLSLGRRVALKVLPFAAALDPRQLARFQNEARAAAQLHHTNIVPVYGVGCERGVHFYAMQLVEGRSLAEVIAELRRPGAEGPAPGRGVGAGLADELLGLDGLATAPRTPDPQPTGPYTPAEGPAADTAPRAAPSTERSLRSPAFFRTAARLGAQAAEALEHAHQLGVVHRDVKPANLLVDGRGHVWVTDFGLAHVQSGQGLTLTGDLVGTLRYMSPEQALAQRVVVDHRTDLYSLGVTLYEVLTLEPAFGGRDRQELLRQIAFEEPRPPRKLNKAIPADLETIVLKAMAKNPAERYATAQDLADDLRRFLEDRPIRARRPTLAQRGRKLVRRHRAVVTTMVGGAFAVAAVAIALLVYSNVQIEEKRKETQSALNQSRESAEQLRLEKRQAQVSLSTFLLDRGLALCEQGEVDLGLLWLARALGQAPEDAGDLQRVIRVNLAAWSRQTHHLRAVLPLRMDTEATFSPDGQALLVVDRGGYTERKREARPFDVSAGRQVGAPFGGPLPTPSGLPLSSRILPGPWAFSPDRRWLVSLSDAGTLQLWDVAKRRPVGPPLTHAENWADRVMFSADGRVLLTCAIREQVTPLSSAAVQIGPLPGCSVRLWESATGKPIGKPIRHPDTFGVLALSPDGRAVVTGPRGKSLLLWDAATGEPRGVAFRPLDPPLQGIANAAFSPDGRVLFAVYVDTAMKWKGQFWDVATGRPASRPLPIESVNTRVAFSPDGKFLLTYGTSGGGQGAIQRWYVDGYLGLEGEGYRIIQSEGALAREAVLDVGFSPDGRTFLTSGGGKTRLWDVATGNLIGVPLHHESPGLAFHPDGRTFLSRSPGAVPSDMRSLQVWEVAAGGPRPLWTADLMGFAAPGAGMGTLYPVHWMYSWAFHRKMSSLGLDWATTWPGEMSPVTGGCVLEDVRFGKGGEAVLTAFRARARGRGDYVLGRAQESATGKPADDLFAVKGGQLVALTPDGSAVLTVTARRFWERGREKYAAEKTLQLWEAGTWKPVGPPRKFRCEGGLWDVAFSRDGRTALLAGEKAQLRDVLTGAAVGAAWPTKRVLALSPDGKTAVVRTPLGAELRDAATGAAVGPPLRHQHEVLAAAFSPDGRKVLTGSEDRTARFWEVPAGTPSGSPLHHAAAVSAVAFSPDGRTALTGTEEATARFWDVATGKPLGPPLSHASLIRTFVRGKTVRRVAFAPDGRTALTAMSGGHVRRWEAPPEPVQGSVERVALWVATLTDRDLDSAGVVGWQRPEKWQENRRRLAALGGPPAPPEDELAWHRREAEACGRDHFWFAALWHLDRLIAALPSDRQLHATREQVRTKLREHAAAVADHLRAEARKRDPAEAPHDLGLALYEHRRRLDEVIAAYRKAIRLRPKFPEAHFDLGNALRDQGKLDEAVAEYRQAVKDRPELADAHFQLGILLANHKHDQDGAIAAFREAVRHKPDLAHAHHNLGLALMYKGQVGEAVTALREAVRLQPGEATFHNNLGIALTRQGKTGEAITAYRQALASRPNYAAALFNLAWQLAGGPDPRLRDPRQALALAQRGIKLEPQSVGFWQVLGWAHYRVGAWKESIAALEKSMALEKGGDAGQWFFLAMAHWRLGHKGEARRWYDRAVAWTDKHQRGNEDLRRFRAEAAGLLGLKQKE